MVEIDERILRPDSLAQSLPCHQFSWMFQENRKNLEGLPLQGYPDTPLPQFSGLEVRLEQAETGNPRRTVRLAHRSRPSHTMRNSNALGQLPNFRPVQGLLNNHSNNNLAVAKK